MNKSGYLLKNWLLLRKITEIREKVIEKVFKPKRKRKSSTKK
jgi:hypothetical protein